MRQKRFFAVSLMVLVSAIAAVGFTLFSLSGTVGELAMEMERSTADAILAEAKISDEDGVLVPILYYDQFEDPCGDLYDVSARDFSRQFEWAECGYYNTAYETGLSEPVLNSEFLPVATGAGELLPNRGVDFSRWFSVVEGESKSYGSTLLLSYEAESASFGFFSEEFYPLDKFSGERNELFTLNLGVPIAVLMDGREEFSITADDDTFVYIGDKLVLDLGGVHGAMTGRFRIKETGEVYAAVGEEEFDYSGVRLEEGAGTVVRVFHADRNSAESVFKIKFSNMLLNIQETTLASGEQAQVAYDPENPSYVAPLGESLTVRPDRSRAILTTAVTEMMILGILMVVIVVITSSVVRCWRRDRIQE